MALAGDVPKEDVRSQQPAAPVEGTAVPGGGAFLATGSRCPSSCLGIFPHSTCALLPGSPDEESLPGHGALSCTMTVTRTQAALGSSERIQYLVWTASLGGRREFYGQRLRVNFVLSY